MMRQTSLLVQAASCLKISDDGQLMLGQAPVSWDWSLVGVGTWAFIGGVLHYEARRVINALQE